MDEGALIESVRIGEDEIQAVRAPDGEGHAVLRALCEPIGVDYEGQRQRLLRQPWATTCVIQAVAQDGKVRDLFCLHVKSVPMWLATIDAGRVSASARPKLELYQREAADALYRWATGNLVAKPQSLEQRALAVIGELQARVAEQQRELDEARPKALWVDEFVDADGLYGLHAAGRTLKQRPQKFVEWLKAEGFLFYQGGTLHPRYQYRDWFRVLPVVDASGAARAQTKVTPVGLVKLGSILAARSQMTLVPTTEAH